MRLFPGMIAMLVAVGMAGCGATKQEVAANLGDRFVGKNVDVLVSELGPPTSAFRMNTGGELTSGN